MREIRKGFLFPWIVLVTMLPVVAVSCEKPEPEPDPAPVVTYSLALSSEDDASVVMSSAGGTKSIAFTASADWTAQIPGFDSGAWVTLSSQSGKAGSNTLTLTVKENDATDDRSLTVKITCGTASKTINVTQKQKNALTLSASKFEVGSDGGKFTLTVKANITCSIDPDENCKSWVKVAKTKAMSSTDYSVVVEPNDDVSKREGTITVTGEGLTETVHVYQSGSTPSIVLTRNEYVLSYEPTSFSVEVSHNVDVSCVIASGADWVTRSETKAMSTSRFDFNVAENASSDVREAEIRFVNNDNGLSESVKVTQNFKGALVVAKSEYEIGCEAGQFSVTVGHNVDFTFSCPSWISHEQTKAYEEEDLVFYVKRNGVPDKREGSIVFTSGDGTLKQEVKVVQTGADWASAPADEMWYQSATGSMIEFPGTDALFDVAIVSNTYEDGYGVLKLSGAPTEILESGFMSSAADYMSITRIALPSSLRTIGRSGLTNLRALTELTIPEGVVEIKDDAICQLSAIETVTLPESLTTIGYNVFGYSPVKRFLGPCRAIVMEGMALTRDFRYVEAQTGVDYSGKWIVKVSSDAVDVVIPDGINAVDNGAFKDCRKLESLVIPSSVKYVGNDNFKSDKFRYIGGPYASADNRCYISYGKLQAFAPAGVKSYTTPSSSTVIGAQVFSGCKELEELVINDEVTAIEMYAFSDCPNLKSITLPASLKSMSYDPFNGSTALESIYVRSLVPPSTSITYTVDFPNLKIYVPDSVVEIYRNSDSWSQYRQYITPKHYDGLEAPDYYVSTDFSAKGRVTCLQEASEGSGINVVIMGDAFSDRQIADGTYGQWMSLAMESFFSVEPYKTYRSLFNVYSVDVVSNTEGFAHGDGALGTYFGSGTFVNGNVETIKSYAFKAVDESSADDLTVIVIPNKDVYAGTCNMTKPSAEGGYAQGLSISWIPASSNKETFATTLNHEVGGHGFGKLIDEYYYAGTTPTQYDIDGYSSDKVKYNWYLNFDFTTSENDVSWSGFLQDPRYRSEALGIFEGAYYQYGAYRPRESSIMRYNVGGYNAPSREIIYKRMMSLAYGSSWTYDYEEFVEYDSKNVTAFTTAAYSARKVPAPFVSERDFIPLARPVVVEHNPRVM